ncbi:MAG TPA: hypothetical protein VMB48_12175 [Steroidobacteraceae bacterium]|nr:hypothetical protein [Steroidobacteraceae bacterium]
MELSGPATLSAVVQAVVRLAALDESEVLQLASSGELRRAFPFRPAPPEQEPADFVGADELVQASPGPLSAEKRAALIQSSMPERRAGAPLRQMASGSAKPDPSFGEDLLQFMQDQSL